MHHQISDGQMGGYDEQTIHFDETSLMKKSIKAEEKAGHDSHEKRHDFWPVNLDVIQNKDLIDYLLIEFANPTQGRATSVCRSADLIEKSIDYWPFEEPRTRWLKKAIGKWMSNRRCIDKSFCV